MIDLKQQWCRIKSLFSRVTNWDGFWWIVAIACVLGIGTLFSWLFWEELHGDQESLSTTIRNLGLVVGGIIAMLLAVWRSQVATRQADTAQQGLLNERYQQGAEMLGSEVLSVRLGGIYALERLAVEHPGLYHIQVMKLFCSFVRNPTKDENDEDIVVRVRPQFMVSSLREDVQAVLTAIGNRSEEGLGIEEMWQFRLDLHGANLIGAYLPKANLAGADLSGANLLMANFPEANLSNAFLFGAFLSPPPTRDQDILEDTETVMAWLGVFPSGSNISGAWFSRAGVSSIKGLTQRQLDKACADPDDPPKLHGVRDALTGDQLEWRGKVLR